MNITNTVKCYKFLLCSFSSFYSLVLSALHLLSCLFLVFSPHLSPHLHPQLSLPCHLSCPLLYRTSPSSSLSPSPFIFFLISPFSCLLLFCTFSKCLWVSDSFLWLFTFTVRSGNSVSLGIASFTNLGVSVLAGIVLWSTCALARGTRCFYCHF